MTSTDEASHAPAEAALLQIAGEVAPAFEADWIAGSPSAVQPTASPPDVGTLRRFVRNDDWAGVGDCPRHLELHGFAQAPSDPDAVQRIIHDRATHMIDDLQGTESAVYRALGSHRDQAELGRAILFVRVDVDAAWNDAFLRWYVGEHVPAVLEAPGMISARRFENHRFPAQANVDVASKVELPLGEHRYCTVYEMEDASVISRPETLAASARGACPEHLQPRRRAFNRVYAEVAREVRKP